MLRKLHLNLLESFEEHPVLGLAHGKMGICIYFYLLGKQEGNEEYLSIGKKMLNDVITNLSPNHSIDLEGGLTGIALGIRYLILNGYESGNINEILEDIDNQVYKIISKTQSRSDARTDFDSSINIQLLYYLYIRLIDLDIESDNAFLFKRLVTLLVNWFGDEIPDSFYKELPSYSLYYYNLPFLLYVFNALWKLDIHNNKIKILLSGIVKKVLSHRPLLHANKIYLLWGLLSISDCINSTEWDNYILDIHSQIDLNFLLNNEMKNQDIFFSNGLASIYVLLEAINESQSQVYIPFDPKIFHERLINSNAWSTLQDRPSFFKIHKGLFNGFPGATLILQTLKKKLIDED